MQTTTTTTKWQITIPKKVREKIGLKRGAKIDIFPTEDGFVGKIKRPSNILKYAGDLKHLDTGEPYSVIRDKAYKLAFADKYKQK